MAAKKDRRFVKLQKSALQGLTQAQVESRVASARARAARNLEKGEWRVALPAAVAVISAESVLATRDVLNGTKEGWRTIERLTYGHALSCVGNPFAVSVNRVTGPLAHLFVLDDARLFRRLAKVGAEVASEKDGLWREATCMHFLTILHGRVHGYEGKAAFPPDGYQPLLDQLAVGDAEALREALVWACDRHLDQAGLDQNTVSQEFELGYELLPVEILAFRAARERMGLGFPTLDHPLMQTKLAEVPATTSYDYREDPELDPGLELIRKAVVDFDF